jgi:hypothetical protein
MTAKDTFYIDDMEIKNQHFAEIEKEDGEVFYEVSI